LNPTLPACLPPDEQDPLTPSLPHPTSLTQIEEFWRFFNCVRAPSQIDVGANLYVFKEGIQPAWEHEANQKGGQWVFSFFDSNRAHIDDAWERLLIAMIGENLDDGDDVCGLVVNRRGKQDRIAIWNRNASDDAGVQTLFDNSNEIASAGTVGHSLKHEYNAHSASMSGDRGNHHHRQHRNDNNANTAQ
jgi:translation initiation factor 4E